MKLRVILQVVVFLSGSVSYAQKTDSLAIADFFAPTNGVNVNATSKDSLFTLVKKDPVLKDLYQFYEAKLYLQTGQIDLAKEKAETGLKAIPKDFEPFAKVKYINIIASVHAHKQETKQAIALFQKALRISDEADEKIQSSLLRNNIANMYFSLVDYPSAYKYISEAYETMKNHPEHPFYGNMLSVLSISEAMMEKMDAAKKHGEMALKKAEESGNLIAIIVSNLSLGEVANNKKEFQKATSYLEKSLELSEKYQQKNFIILNSIGLMSANIGLEKYKEAVQYGERALELADNGGDQTTLYSIKKELAEAYFGVGKSEKAYLMMHESHDIFRDKNSIENKKAINDILVKYDTERKEKQLIASENELLEKKIERNNLIGILAALFVVVIALVLGMLFIRNRNVNRLALLKSKQDKEVMQAVFEGEELERERIATELHDGVASNLTAVRYQLMANQNIPQEEKDKLDNILVQAHEDTRRLSHNLAPLYLEKYGFEKALKQFAIENSTDNCSIALHFIAPEESINNEKAIVLYRVAQELTQNAIKHAQAKQIDIQVLVNDEICLIVEDDGVGFDLSEQTATNGLSSLKRRAEQLNGRFEIDSSPGKGTSASFNIV